MSKINTDLRIEQVVNSTICTKHNKDATYPCWTIETDIVERSGRVRQAYGICGRRVAAAGFNGKISAQSMQQKTSGGRSFGFKRA